MLTIRVKECDSESAHPTMFERVYRQRLETDLVRWQADGVIAPAVAAAIRATLRPLPAGIGIATVVAIVGGLLIAAAFLAFIAANWTDIARPLRFCILLAGIAAAYAMGGWFARGKRPILADLGASVGSIIFGAAIALVGQMYHLADDFAGGFLLWALGALVAAVLTGSRGALAVALVAACWWDGARMLETSDVPHLPFVAFWLVGAGLAVVWNAPAARHLVALAALEWWFMTGVGLSPYLVTADPAATSAAGAALLVGGGLALATLRPDAVRALGLTLSTYGAFALAAPLPWIISETHGVVTAGLPDWIIACATAGAALALLAAALGRRAGPAFAGLASGLVLVVVAGWTRPPPAGEPFLAYASSLIAMLCLVVSGMLDGVRPRVVAGWLGLAAVIAAITWAVEGSLLRRSVFLGVAGAVAVTLALLLGRLMPEEADR